jgi:hypothetical protein
MTDLSSAKGGRPRRRRDPSLGDSHAPVTTIVVLATAAVAVVAGFLILRSVTDETARSDEPTGGAVTTVTATPTSTTAIATTVATTAPTTSTTTTTLAPLVAKSEATVVVVNASGVDRSATAMAEELSADGYTTAPVANSTGPQLERSIIYYLGDDDAAFGVARLLATQIPTARTLRMPETPPLDRPLEDATVALMLGLDAAGRPLADLATD